jgi:four helix bundle protein
VHDFRKLKVWHRAIASGSAAEAESHLEVASALRYVNARQYEALRAELDAIQRMLNRLIQNLP